MAKIKKAACIHAAYGPSRKLLTGVMNGRLNCAACMVTATSRKKSEPALLTRNSVTVLVDNAASLVCRFLDAGFTLSCRCGIAGPDWVGGCRNYPTSGCLNDAGTIATLQTRLTGSLAKMARALQNGIMGQPRGGPKNRRAVARHLFLLTVVSPDASRCCPQQAVSEVIAE